MIKDKLVNYNKYTELSKNIKEGLNWLEKTNLINIKDGKYTIRNNEIYANVQTYETKDNARYEAHKKYIDIQYIVKGKELVGICPVNECIAQSGYDEDNDIEFMDSESANPYILLNEGEFLILYPSDAHKPSIKCNKKQIVKKVVVKVAV